MSRALVILSGGQDSTTCLYLARKQFKSIHALTFDYGQRHSAEIECARTVGYRAGVKKHEVCRLGEGILQGTSPLINKKEKLEQYKDWKSLPGGLEKTFVPNRNALFITIAVNRAYVDNIKDIFLGVCQEDFGGYPDCRETFIKSMEQSMRLANDYDITLHTPLMHLTKAEIVKLAATLPGCMESMAWTHTGYDGSYPPIGKDHATLLRAKGFEEAGLPDPLVLRAVKDGLMALPESANYDEQR